MNDAQAEDRIHRALDYLGKREKQTPLCPRCARRPVSGNGACRPCLNDLRRLEEETAERIRASKRRYEAKRRAEQS